MRLIPFILLILVSCAGYNPVYNRNPLKKYGVRSLAIEPFYNQSTLSSLGPDFTKEMFLSMSDFSELRIENDHNKADATLIGLITSAENIRKTRTTEEQISAKSIFENKIGGNRRDFFLPTKTKLKLRLKLIIVRNLSKLDLELMQASGEIIDPRVILSEVMSLDESYDRLLLKEQSVNYAGTQNRGALKGAVHSLAKKAANDFKEKLLYAF